MAFGNSRPRNWGKESQQAALELAMLRQSVAWRATPTRAARRLALWLTPSRDGVTLPFREVAADLFNVRRGRWEARHPFDGRLLAVGVSERDVIRATIQTVWH